MSIAQFMDAALISSQIVLNFDSMCLLVVDTFPMFFLASYHVPVLCFLPDLNVKFVWKFFKNLFFKIDDAKQNTNYKNRMNKQGQVTSIITLRNRL